jgi:hypothetical protein
MIMEESFYCCWLVEYLPPHDEQTVSRGCMRHQVGNVNTPQNPNDGQPLTRLLLPES